MEDKDSNRQGGAIYCTNCNAEIMYEAKFCSCCGEKIESIAENVYNIQKCPNCHAEIEPSHKFCTECGTTINSSKDRLKNNSTSLDIDSVSKTGKDIIKGFGGFLNKTVDEIESSLNNKPSSTRRPLIHPIRKKGAKKPNLGFLVCDNCNGIYKLRPGESPSDFLEVCRCGGNLKHEKTIPKQ